MSDEVTRQAAESLAERNVSRDHYDWMVWDRDSWKRTTGEVSAERDAARADLEVATEERDAAQSERGVWRAEATRLTEAGTGLIIQLNVALADVERLTAERDAAMVEVRSHIAANRMIAVERDAAEEKCRKLHAENEGLRADALAYPPQRIEFTQYVNLKADYDRQVIMIETLQEGLKRTESLLAKAQAQHIDDRLKGFLSVISQLADQAQDLLP